MTSCLKATVSVSPTPVSCRLAEFTTQYDMQTQGPWHKQCVFVYSILRTHPQQHSKHAHDCGGRSVPLERLGSGVGVENDGFPIRPPAKLKPAAATVTRAILDSPNRAESKIALVTVAGRGNGYELAVTS
jgi:hypothetical protein